MVNCCVPYCSSYQNCGVRVSYHQFPSDYELSERWLRVISRDCFQINSKSASSLVCSLHFREEDYVPDLRVKKLKKGSIPSIFPGYPAYKVPKQVKVRNAKKHEVSHAAKCALKRKYDDEHSDDTLSKRKRLKRDCVPSLKLPSWSIESEENLKTVEKKKTRKVPQSKEKKVTSETYEDMNEEIHPISDERLILEFKEPDVSSAVDSDISYNSNEAVQITRLRKDTNVSPEVKKEIIDFCSDDEEINLIENESSEIIKQKFEKLLTHHKKLKKHLKESQMLCKLYAKENVSLKSVIDSLRQIIMVSNNT